MELKDKNIGASDDEDDLEKLRLAALQSLKRTVPAESKNIHKNVNKSPQSLHKRRNFQGRNSRNGQYYNRPKNTNLISIPTIGDEFVSDLKSKTKYCDDTVHKLILPQDRYCHTKNIDDKPTEQSSKFDRYDNSDKSDSESECDENIDSESESPGKLEKSNSLEALMQELENEIQGDSKPKEEKLKSKVKKRKVKPSISAEIPRKDNLKEVSKTENVNEAVEDSKVENGSNVEKKEEEKEYKFDAKKTLKFKNMDRKKIPLNKRFYKKYHSDRSVHNATGFVHQPYVPSVMYPENIHFNQTLPFNPVMPYNNLINQPLLPLNVPQSYVPPIYDRPPSPLSLTTDDVLTITRAPLSPRSAAFVLQNREIIERRKKSPRRSYSRSPSPRYRRSTSPLNYSRSLRSPSPRKFLKSKSRSPRPSALETTRKLSPCKDKLDPLRERRTPPVDRKSPQRAVSPTKDRRSPLRNRVSPHRQRYVDRKSPTLKRAPPIEKSPKANYHNSPKGSVRERLGNKTNRLDADVNLETKIRKRSRSLSLSPEPNELKEKLLKSDEDCVKDPVLEARRKKFETNEIKNTEGIIRLKPKAEDAVENGNIKESIAIEETVNEDELLDLLNTKVDDIFSDEETDEENEGRFKSNLTNPQRNVSVLPFTQLLDDTRNIKAEVLKGTKQNTRNSERERKKPRSRSPLRSKDSRNYKERTKTDDSKASHVLRRPPMKDKQVYARNKILFKNESSRKDKMPVTAPIENKKIEIKIINPSKYETTSKYDVANEHETLERIEKSVRKVEVSDVKRESDIENSDSEIINSNEDLNNADAHLNQKCEAGDLRAQLSRKRAERQNKLPVPEDVQSRLLQNALQGAVFKKPKRSRKEKESAPKDGKLPIHLRLGFANNMDIFQETNVKRKRSKSKGRIEQV